MRERALRVGRSGNLVGILTEPAPGAVPAGQDRPAVVFLNSGILHRPGASRLYVQIARRLAADGFTSMRFDFSGVGDSEPRRDSLPFVEAAVAETRDVMDYLSASKRFSRFVLAGLCSGADMAYYVALEDERVVGIAKLDAWAYRTWKYYLRHYGPRLLDPGVWKLSITARGRALARRIGRRDPDSAVNGAYVPPEYRRRFPPRDEVRRGLEALAGRGVSLYYFFTGDQGDHLNYRSQYEECFRSVDFGGRIQVEYDPAADHTITGLRHQRLVADQIALWMTLHFGAPEGVQSGTGTPVTGAG